MRGAGPLDVGCEDIDRRSEYAACQVAAGVFARCPHRPRVRSGLAAWPDGRHQIRQLNDSSRHALIREPASDFGIMPLTSSAPRGAFEIPAALKSPRTSARDGAALAW